MDKERLDRILQGSSLPWWEWDVKGNSVAFNDLKATMLGYETRDFRGKGYDAFTRLIHPDDYGKTMEAMRRVLRKETKLYQTDYRIRAKDGRYTWYMDRGYVISASDSGDPLFIRGIVIDLGYEDAKSGRALALVSILEKSVRRDDPSRPSFITLCSNCLKTKKSETEWIELDSAIVDLIGEDISHGICPACVRQLYPEFAAAILAEMGAE